MTLTRKTNSVGIFLYCDPVFIKDIAANFCTSLDNCSSVSVGIGKILLGNTFTGKQLLRWLYNYTMYTLIKAVVSVKRSLQGVNTGPIFKVYSFTKNFTTRMLKNDIKAI